MESVSQIFRIKLAPLGHLIKEWAEGWNCVCVYFSILVKSNRVAVPYCQNHVLRNTLCCKYILKNTLINPPKQ